MQKKVNNKTKIMKCYFYNKKKKHFFERIRKRNNMKKRTKI